VVLPLPTRPDLLNIRRDQFYFAIGIVFLASGIYGRALLPGHTFVADVLFRYFLPQYSLLKQALAHHELPFWNPYLSCGMPALANPQSSVFYPGTYLFALCNFGLAIKIHVVAHAILACFFMTLLAGSLGFKPMSARLAGIVYAFNGFAVLHFQLPVHLQVYAWTPLVVYALCKALSEHSRSSLVAGAGSLTLLFFCGYTPFIVYSVLIAVAMAAAMNQEPMTRLLGKGGFLFAAALALATVQIGPTLQLALQSSRAAGLGQEWLLAKSLHWGEIGRMTFCPLWNWYLHIHTDTGVAGFYWGYPVLALAALAMLEIRRSGLVRVLLFLFLFGMVLSTGQEGRLYPILAKYVWPFGWLRYPSNALFMSNFAVALLAGLGMERFKERAGLCLILACVLDLGLFAQRAYETIETSFYNEVPPTARFLQNHVDGGRLFMTPPSAERLDRTGKTRYDAFVNFVDSIILNYPTVFQLHDVAGGEDLQVDRYRHVKAELEKSHSSPWLNIVGARYLLSFWDLPERKKLWEGPSGIQVFENVHALPRAYYISRAVCAPAIDSFNDISTGRQDPQKAAVLNDPRATIATGKFSPSVPLTVEDLSPNHLRIRLEAAQPGWVVLSDNYDSGWRARNGNRPTAIYRTNFIQQSVAVPAGPSELDWRYRPRGWNWMKSISLTTALFLTGFLMIRKEDKL
jgi:hypothetical protein